MYKPDHPTMTLELSGSCAQLLIIGIMDAFSVTNQQLVDTLGIELWRIPIVIVAASGIYLVFLLLVRIFGARVLSGLTGFDIVVGVMLGAVAGRVIIGHPPTLAAVGCIKECVVPHVELSAKGKSCLSDPEREEVIARKLSG